MDFRPGITPCGHRVLVCPVLVERKTAGGIILHDTAAEREDMAQIEAVVVAVGANAWKDQPSGEWAKPGDKVLIAKYSGLTRKGVDERMYRVISDLDVVALCEQEGDHV